MVIHHSQTKKAAKLGFTLSENDGEILAHWPERNWMFSFEDTKDAIEKMELIINHAKPAPEMTHQDAMRLIGRALSPEPHDEQEGEEVLRSDNNIPIDGAVAFDEGVDRDENPYTNETLKARWNQQWDAAKHEAEPEEQEDKHQAGDGEFAEDDKPTVQLSEKSVVKSKYRVRYAEQGHPKHCGDWLAQVLNNLVGGKEKTNLELFEIICKLNGVDVSKYRQKLTHGWQGRLRMTGRNMLAKVVWKQGHLKVPTEIEESGMLPVPGDWVADQRFTKAAVDNQPKTETPAE